MTSKEFIPEERYKTLKGGVLKWQSPSNIALVKYWGKKENQIPANPSISFTLSHCKTITSVEFQKRKNPGNNFDFQIYLDAEEQESFRPKIQKFFERVEVYLPFLKDFTFNINTSNTFPHSSGIASSASGMSALALCLMSIEKELNSEITPEYFLKKASFLARLGSGSACRSIKGELVVWGENNFIPESSDLYGIKYKAEVHPVFKEYQDVILLVDKGEKQVSSTLGHNLMHDHIFAEQRFKQANDNLKTLPEILETGNLSGFIEVVEREALSLHAMMMTSQPYFLLMKPNTLAILNKIMKFRSASGLHPCFTLDAGANVHLLFPKHEKEEIMRFVKDELIEFCQEGQYICDQSGKGAMRIL